MPQEVAEVWFVSMEKMHSLFKWNLYDDKGTLEIAPDRLRFTGKKISLGILNVKKIALVRPRIPWLSVALSNALIAAIIFGGITSYYTWNNPESYVLWIVVTLLYIFILAVHWIRIDYVDEEGHARESYFSACGWTRLWGGTKRICESIERNHLPPKG